MREIQSIMFLSRLSLVQMITNVLGKDKFDKKDFSRDFFLFDSYLNHWDKQIPHLDVADDYRSERHQILKMQGKDFPFSFGDVCSSKNFFSRDRILVFVFLSKYVVKVLMGSVDEWFDTLDERRVSRSGSHSGRSHKGKKNGSCEIL